MILLVLVLVAPSELDFRGNDVENTILETEIAVTILKEAETPIENVEPVWDSSKELLFKSGMPSWTLLKAHVKLLLENGLALAEKSTFAFLEAPLDDPDHLRKFYSIFSDPRVNFKNAFDEFTTHVLDPHNMCMPPSGIAQKCVEREKSARDQWYFALDSKGREKIPEALKLELSRKDSIYNTNAGIATLENVPEIARDFFYEVIFHGGKNLFERMQQARIVKVFEAIGAPFIAGPSGSLMAAILTMENMDGPSTEASPYPNGLIVDANRSPLICLWASVLLASGHHSFFELILGAKALGYLSEIDIPGVTSEVSLLKRCERECYLYTIHQLSEFCASTLRIDL